MDIATIVGIISAVAIVISAIIIGENPAIFVNLQGILIVLGGTFATTLVRFPLKQVLKTAEVVKNAFNHSLQTPYEVIDELVSLARKSRKEGLLSLEDYQTDDQFLARGLQLIVDGAESEAVETILMTEIRYVRQRHSQGQDILKSVGEAAPAFGMIGTLIGLVLMLANMQDVETLGPAMAVAILTTLYGSLIANVFALPLAKKLEIRSRQESLVRELMLVGLISISKGENPRMIETVLKAFLSENDLPTEPPPEKERELEAA